jgi:broad specificity phosphatase PhoE
MSVPELLVLVRHAQSQSQLGKRGRYFTDEEKAAWQGDFLDRAVPITEKGSGHARRVGHKLRAAYGVFDFAWCADYVRTEETAKALLEAYPLTGRLKIKTSPLLRERDVGYFFSLTDAEVRRDYPHFDEYRDTVGQLDFRWRGGESLLPDVYQRVLLWKQEQQLSGAWAGKRILVVASWGSLMMLRYFLEDWTREDFERHAECMENCSVTVYREEKGILRLQYANKLLCK